MMTDRVRKEPRQCYTCLDYNQAYQFCIRRRDHRGETSACRAWRGWNSKLERKVK